MIISRAEINSVISAYRTAKRKPTVATVSVDTADSFERSDEAWSIGSLVQAASEPYYRTDRVADLQRRISEGRYFVPAEDIVDKLLGRLIVEAAV